MTTLRKLSIALPLAMMAGAAGAAGPLYLSDESGSLKPITWDTGNGPIPVYTDGGGAFTYDYDGATPFITIDRANEITAFAFGQWSQVPTSTFRAEVAGTIAERTGIADVTGDNADKFYGVENGYGFWVLYDTDGSILENYFGVSRDSVLGIAFPEFTDENGTIIEATAVMNGWAVHVDDPQGVMAAGVFAHEFGHALNLSHSQVNGPMVYQSYSYLPRYPGVPKCPGVEPLYHYAYPASSGLNRADPAIVETMFPFIDSYGGAGREQSTIDSPDDIAGISNLYPTADYKASRGSISGVLTSKDGTMQYSGVNVVARNVDNPLFDALSDMTGSATQGEVGPDGRYTIGNLTPGQRYVVYIERITAGGYPTTPRDLLSQGEYWNTAEGADPAVDQACEATPILAEAGVTKTADITFNGYMKGVSFKPVVSAFITSLAKNGQRGSGFANGTPFIWDDKKGFELLPPDLMTDNGQMDRNGQQMIVLEDRDGNGLQAPAIWSANRLLKLGDLNGNTCGSSSIAGRNSAIPRGMDDAGKTVVGLAYVDRDGDGSCSASYANEIVPFIWNARGGIRELDTAGLPSVPQFARANAVSGDGSVVLGTAGFRGALAWVNGGKVVNLQALTGANDVNAVNYDGTRVALDSASGRRNTGVKLWNAHQGVGPEAFTSIDGLRYCRDVPLLQLGQDMCTLYGEAYLYDTLGNVPTNVFASNDDGSVLVGRAGSFRNGVFGAIWIEDLGWMTMTEFLRRQGVVEAQDVPVDNPIAISASGSEISAGIAGVAMTWLIEADQVYVCKDGKSVMTGFPAGLRAMVKQGAQFGRCEFLR